MLISFLILFLSESIGTRVCPRFRRMGARQAFVSQEKTWRADPTESGLVVTSVVPGWGFGWRGIFKDEMSEDFFSWLGHYCRQYIHRSNTCKVLMASWERDGIILHPFGSGGSAQRYSGSTSAGSQTDILAAAMPNVTQNWGPLLVNPTFYRSSTFAT